MARKNKFQTPTAIAHNYILNMDFQGEDIWVATAQGLSHGIREPQKEALLYAAEETGSAAPHDSRTSHSRKRPLARPEP